METLPSIIVAKNASAFLCDFIEIFTTNPSMRESLMHALMQVCVTKLKGKFNNLELRVKGINFFIACNALSRKTFDFVSASMLGSS